MPKVLVIDDDPVITKTIEVMLKGTEFVTAAVHSGADGIEQTRAWKPDVILLDLMMPGVSGWEVCREIRAFSQVPILILSGVTDTSGVMRSLDEGATDYLVKPVPRGILLSHLKILTNSASITP